MNMLPYTNPDVDDAFINEGNFVISRTPNAFSAMGIDPCQEQLNKLVKGEGVELLASLKMKTDLQSGWFVALRLQEL